MELVDRAPGRGGAEGRVGHWTFEPRPILLALADHLEGAIGGELTSSSIDLGMNAGLGKKVKVFLAGPEIAEVYGVVIGRLGWAAGLTGDTLPPQL